MSFNIILMLFTHYLISSVSQSDDGWLHKAVEVEGQLHIIEELQVFEEQQPITTVLISGKLVTHHIVNSTREKTLSFQCLDQFFTPPPHQTSVYVGAASGVAQLPFSNCHRYTSCYDCIFARDPHCAWNGSQCVDVMGQGDR